jgi:superfamily II DNA/RNA helicase
VLGKARTGSGKTLAFGLPTLARLANEGRATPNRPVAVVLVPTRELAMQVNDALEPYAHALGVSLRLVAGGLSMSKQIQALDRGVHLLVATPGRLADLVRQRKANMSNVSITVLDEADHMAQMGFMDEINEILAETPRDGQRLLFSATLDGDVEDLIRRWMHSPVTHDVTAGDAPPEMEHVALNVPPQIKYQLATRIANRQGRTIAFVRTKLAAERIAEQMREAGVLAVALHGDKPQNERTAAITGFRAGSIPVLVATDVAARGIHVDHVDLVLQIDPPTDPKDYTHRAGRTARAGEAGLIVTIVLPHQRKSTDRMFEQAAIEPLFRKVRGDDADSLALVDRLTGGSEPSSFPVAAPAVKIDERDWRAKRDAGRRSARDAHNGAGKRAPGRGSRPDRGDKRASSARAEELSRREAELIERERALAEREQQLTTRESTSERRGAAPRGSKPYKGAKSTGGKSYGSKPRGDKPHGDKAAGDKPGSDKPYRAKPYRSTKPRKPRSR